MKKMERKTYVYVFIVTFVVVLSAVSIYLIFAGKGSVDPVGSPGDSEGEVLLEECYPVMYSGAEAINLVFFSPKEEAQRYADFLLETTPFNQHAGKFNVFTISDYEPECEYYKGIAILCYSKDLVRKASSCPNDYVVVLREESSYLRSSAYLGVMTLNSNHPLTVFLHEFGHVFANFAEEYFVQGGKIPSGSKNCQKECENFGETNDGCFQECTTGTHYRSVKEGVMRTLSSNFYGVYNELLLSNQIERSFGESQVWYNKVEKSSKVTGSAVALENVEVNCREKNHILIGIKDGEAVSEERVKGCANSGGAGAYSVSLTGKDGSEIKRSINPENIFIDWDGEKEEGVDGAFLIEDATYYVSVPISDEIVGADILDNEGEVITEVINSNKFLRSPCLVE
jgi:hypothetical protein